MGAGGVVPVYFLDANLPENSDADRALTDVLYGGDARYRLCREAILRVGGFRMLRALGYDSLTRFHVDEGHARLGVYRIEVFSDRRMRPERRCRGGDHGLDVCDVRGGHCFGGGSTGNVFHAELEPRDPV